MRGFFIHISPIYLLHKSAVYGKILLYVYTYEVITISHTFSRENIGGIEINRIIDPKFTSGIINIRLFADYDKETAPAYVLLPQLLCATNNSYPTQEALTKRLNELYGGNIWGSCAMLSELLELCISCNFLLDRFALNGEKIALLTAELLLECLFDPVVFDGGLDPVEFEVRKQDLLDSIDNEINERSSYAVMTAYQTIFKGETAANRNYYSREAVEALTPKSCYEAYKKLLKKSRVYITVCSGEPHPEIEALLLNALQSIEVDTTPIDFYSPSPLKATAEYVAYPMDIKQSTVVLGFKSDNRDYFATRLFSLMYGESPTSILSMNVREKMSLCYYCQSSYSESKNTLTVVSGVDNANVEKAQSAIISLLKDMSEGRFTDKDLEEAKLFLTSRIRSRIDRKGSMSDWYFRESLTHRSMTIEEAIAEVNAVTRDRVEAAAKSFKLDTVFTLGKEGGNE